MKLDSEVFIDDFHFNLRPRSQTQNNLKIELVVVCALPSS